MEVYVNLSNAGSKISNLHYTIRRRQRCRDEYIKLTHCMSGLGLGLDGWSCVKTVALQM